MANDAEILVGVDWPDYLGGGNNLGPLSYLQNPSLIYAFTIGKMQAKATLQPAGIENILPYSWILHRRAEYIGWTNGILVGFDTNSFTSDDTSHLPSMDLDPESSGGAIYDLDTPACPLKGGITINHTAEVYDDFEEFAAVILGGVEQTCSNTNTWSYTAQIDDDKSANQVELNSIGTYLINLPTDPHYNTR